MALLQNTARLVLPNFAFVAEKRAAAAASAPTDFCRTPLCTGGSIHTRYHTPHAIPSIQFPLLAASTSNHQRCDLGGISSRADPRLALPVPTIRDLTYNTQQWQTWIITDGTRFLDHFQIRRKRAWRSSSTRSIIQRGEFPRNPT